MAAYEYAEANDVKHKFYRQNCYKFLFIIHWFGFYRVYIYHLE